MKNLAEVVIDHWRWVEQCKKELTKAFDDDFIGDHYEGMISVMNGLDPDEMQAIRDVAAERIRSRSCADLAPDEWAFRQRSRLSANERAFLTGLMNWAAAGQQDR
jgi:hypothetical protein